MKRLIEKRRKHRRASKFYRGIDRADDAHNFVSGCIRHFGQFGIDWDLAPERPNNPPRHPARRAARRRELRAAKSTVEHAMAILSTCDRGELRDHAFGDCEVHWEREGIEIGSGYFGGEANEVSVLVDGRRLRVRFTGADADRLRDAGRFAGASRNDSTGPLRFREGVCLPGLTLAGVLEEIADVHQPTCLEGGGHRWHERGGYEDGDGNWIEPFFRCGDCRLTTSECEDCGELIDPPQRGEKCAACGVDEYERDELCTPLPQEEP